MVDIKAGLQGFEAECGGVAGRGERSRCTAAGAGGRVEVDIVRHGGSGMVGEVYFHLVAFAHTE